MIDHETRAIAQWHPIHIREDVIMNTDNVELNEALENLSPQVREAIMLVLKGLSNKEIAETMSLSLKTIEQYLTAAYKKLDVDGRVKLIIKFLK